MDITCPNPSCQYRYAEEDGTIGGQNGKEVIDSFLNAHKGSCVTVGDEPFILIYAKEFEGRLYSSKYPPGSSPRVAGILLACPKCGTAHFRR